MKVTLQKRIDKHTTIQLIVEGCPCVQDARPHYIEMGEHIDIPSVTPGLFPGKHGLNDYVRVYGDDFEVVKVEAECEGEVV